MRILLLVGMVWAHIIDDFMLQGIMAQMKQRAWWEKQVPDLAHSPYRNDYRAALAAHAFSWSCSIMVLPVLLCGRSPAFWLPLLTINAMVHACIDDLKANKRRINLLQDQGLHLIQIFATWLAFLLAGRLA